MANGRPASNKLADLYDALFTLLEELPDDSHPGWAFAIESVLFGGEGLHPETPCYGEQQAERNDFSMRDYRQQYGDGDHVTDFPAIETETVGPADVPGLDREIAVPIVAATESRLPVSVGDDGLPDALECLAYLPAEPAADHPPEGHQHLLNARRFPSLDDAEQAAATPDTAPDKPPADPAVDPNELAELYDGLLQLFRRLPDDVHPVWEEAIETILFDGEFLYPGRTHYGEQQGTRNHVTMDTYRETFGDGERVRAFAAVDTTTRTDGDDRWQVLQAPVSGVPLPVSPAQSDLAAALALLAEFPARPATADGDHATDEELLFFDALLAKADIEPGALERAADQTATDAEPAPDTETEAPDDTALSEPATATAESTATADDDEETTLRKQEAGESNTPITDMDTGPTESEPKYDDPRAQRAHEDAQRRHPSEVVEKGAEIDLVLDEVDYKYTEPSIMGKKNDLVVFVEDAPQGLSRFDVFRARVIGYGAGETCAKAVFTGYAD